MTRFLAYVFFLAGGMVASTAQAEVLRIIYADRAPYYLTNADGTVAGLVSGKVDQALKQAGIEADWEYQSSKRQIGFVKSGKGNICTPGWFKKPEREIFAKFSDPVYRDKPQIIVVRDKDKSRFTHKTLDELMSDPTFKMGAKLGYSYGAFVDGLLKTHNPRTITTSQDNVGMVKMLNRNRFDYFISTPEEAQAVQTELKISKGVITILPLSDFPQGNFRYLMCSKAVSEDIIQRFNKALAQ